MIAPHCRHIALLPLAVILILVVLFWFDARFLIPLLAAIIIQGFFLFFFRDPPRPIGEDIVSPADGVVMEVDNVHISIFMNIWNVHVNRAPVAGIIVDMNHVPGCHAPAFRNVQNNEHLVTTIDIGYETLTVLQIAGVFARRIVSYVTVGTTVAKGQRLGIVRFGSRVEIRAPKEVAWRVAIGDRIRAGQTIGQLS